MTIQFLPHLKLENHVAIINQYYKITSEFERLGDHAVNIADRAEALNKNNTAFSPAAMSELAVLESAVRNILSEAEQAFAKRDVEAAERIEPLAQVVGDLAIMLRRNHLRRMSIGACDTLADADFTGLLEELHRIGDLCSNVGVATVVRVHPELADHEHFYFERLHAGVDETFNAAYSRAYEKYAALLENTDDVPETEPAP